MSRRDEDNSYQDPRLPQGTTLVALMLIVLATGAYLIASGLF